MTASLRDRYVATRGVEFMTGISALVRFPIDQMRLDRRRGVGSAAFISGYQGSPLGGYDSELARVADVLAEHGIVHQAAVNEELAATAVFGSQVASVTDGFLHDGVLGVWYGKSPGLDRAADAIRHGNMAGTGPNSGVVVVVGDDPACKSSTLPSASEGMCAELGMPVLHPADCQDILDLGLHAVALSRFSGTWAALKVVTSVADANATADVDPARLSFVTPSHDGPPHAVRPILNQIVTRELERDLAERRLPRALAYGVANHLNRVTVDGPDAWLGIIASGHTYLDVLEAFRVLGIGEQHLAELGVRLFRVRMPYPMDRGQLREFASGLDEILVIEEKRPFLELQVKEALYGVTNAPRVTGRHDPDGRALVQSWGALDGDVIAEALFRRLTTRVDAARLRPTDVAVISSGRRATIPVVAARVPWFCSGCPHSTSTKVPPGALVGTGIGCHGLASRMPEERTGVILSNTQMGGEGAQWIGAAPFLARDHVFQNIGDGTLFHSGWLAIRFAVAADAHITFKILNNGAVAMTGGQQPVGVRELPDLVRGLLAEGVKRVIVTTDDTARYKGVSLPRNVPVWDRSRIIEAQELLARERGVTALIHDQRCAAELRRDRKRKRIVAPSQRVAIIERVCEGCGDCGAKSSCLSVRPVETEFGPKTTIDQTSCNLDFSCLEGDCPSFVLVEPSRRRHRRRARSTARVAALPPHLDNIPAPVSREHGDETVVRMPGIGGTGVVTVAQVLGMAASLEGRSVRGLDQTGLSQKAGPVSSDLRISVDAQERPGRASSAGVDVLLCFDLVVATAPEILVGLSSDRTVLIATTSQTPTGPTIGDAEAQRPAVSDLQAVLTPLVRADSTTWVDAEACMQRFQGDSTCANIFLLGIACQQGVLPISPHSVERALALNGVAVEKNTAAFRLGRLYAVDPRQVLSGESDRSAQCAPELPVVLSERIAVITDEEATRELLRGRTADLVSYHSARYAARYLDLVATAAAAENETSGGTGPFTRAVAHHFHKLLAYKDEYEVARLHLSVEARAAAERVGGAGARTKILLHPPVLRALGMTRKMAFGASARPLLHLLVAARRLRSTRFDPFGATALRRTERRLIVEYETVVRYLAGELPRIGPSVATRIASLASMVRGYEEIKFANVRRYRDRLDAELARLAME
jgi:indolepyruvate ferredoxin oxidoreductase